MFFNKIILFNKNIFFKRRSFCKIKNIYIKNKILNYILIKKTIILNFKFYNFFLKKLKSFCKKKYLKVYILFSINLIFSKKSHGSRMGKGKGKFSYLMVKFFQLKPIFFFNGLSKIRLFLFLKLLNKKNNNIFFSKCLKLCICIK